MKAEDFKLHGRRAELDRIESLLSGARHGAGGALLIEGDEGLGKTALLRGAKRLAAGFEVLSARASRLEADVPFGCARQLFEARPPAAWDARDAELRLELHRLCVDLAQAQPLLLEIDDVQWADPSSRLWLAYLLRRLAGLPIALLLALRPGEDDDLRLALREGPVTVSRLSPLSREAMARLVDDRSAGRPAPEFSAALHDATGGVPGLACALLAEAVATGTPFSAEGAERVRELRPPELTLRVQARLARLPSQARELAEAVAVIGPRAEVRHAAALAGLELAAAETTGDDLARAGLLEPRRPLAFAQPQLAGIVRDGLPAGRRARLHGAAARALAEEPGRAGEVAEHLLATTPAGDPWVVEWLRRSAARAASEEVAARYLRRALAEPAPPEQRAALLLELGGAERLIAPALAVDHLREAVDSSTTGPARLEALSALYPALLYAGEDTSAYAAGETAAALAGGDDGWRTGSQADAVVNLVLRYGSPETRRAEFARLRQGAEREHDGALLGVLALRGTESGLATAEESASLAISAIASTAEPRQREVAFRPVWALEFADRLVEAAAEAERLVDIVVLRGSRSDVAFGRCFLAILSWRRGLLERAEDDARTALELARQEQFPYIVDIAGAALLLALTDRGREREADVLLEDLEIDRLPPERNLALVQFARGRLHMAAGRPAEAVADFEAAGAGLVRASDDRPGYFQWRAEAAIAYRAMGDHDRARRRAASELSRVEAFGAARALGVGLRVAGLTTAGEERVDLLRRAAKTLEPSPARLEHARALVDLGSALRLERRPREAREPLLLGLDIAEQCGAAPLALRAREELLAAGARPRRARISGAPALTPSELRTARLAASGATNREIAQRLFLSRRTVEGHLQSAYRKLGFNSREELARILPERVGE